MTRSRTDIRSHILTLITRHPDLTADQIRPHIGPRISLPSVNRELAQLVSQGKVRTQRDGLLLRYRRAA